MYNSIKVLVVIVVGNIFRFSIFINQPPICSTTLFQTKIYCSCKTGFVLYSSASVISVLNSILGGFRVIMNIDLKYITVTYYVNI